MSATDVIIKILEIMAWPSTLIGVILVFRKQFNQAMGRLGSFEASATGVSMSFAPKLDQAKQLYNQLKPADSSKSAAGLKQSERPLGTPMEQVSKLRYEIDRTLVEMAKEHNIDPTGKSPNTLVSELADKGLIIRDKGRLLQAILEVLNTANANITQQQVDEIYQMYNSI
jgi:hypothetical protein